MNIFSKLLGTNPPEPDNNSQDQAYLTKFLNNLASNAKGAHPTEQFNKFARAYAGYPDGQDATRLKNATKYPIRNIIKPITDTRTTLILDIPFDIAVEPTTHYFEDIKQLSASTDIAEVLTSCIRYIENDNDWDSLQEDLAKTAEIYGCAISKVGYETTSQSSDASEGVEEGRITIESIDPSNIFFDPAAERITDCNYIFVRRVYSTFKLKKLYPDRIDDVDKLPSIGEKKASADQNKSAVITYQNQQTTGQAYAQSNGDVNANSEKIIEVWEAYLIDDAIYYPSANDDVQDLQKKTEWAYLYPYGRKVVFSDKYVFEDAPIDYEFGFPFDIYYPQASKEIYGHSLVFDLIEMQKYISITYKKSQSLMNNFTSSIIVDGTSAFNKDQSWRNASMFVTDPGGLIDGKFPRLLTNNTISELEETYKYIDFLEEKAAKSARTNDMMLSGDTETNVNSGSMVESLNASPMSSIRASQKRFREFYISIGNKLIEMIQKHYTSSKIIKLSSGQGYAYINNGAPAAGIDPQIEIYQNDMSAAIKTIKGDLTIGKYKVSVVTGADLPRTKDAQANLIMNVVNGPLLDKDPALVGFVFKAIDMPYGNQIMEILNQKREQAAQQAPPAASLIDKVGMAYKDMPSFAQEQILEQLGIQVPQDGLMATTDEIHRAQQAVNQ